MYCCTYVNQFTCIFNELQLWTRISSEHPIFLKIEAALSKIELPKATEGGLDDIHEKFSELYNDVMYVKRNASVNPNLYVRYIFDTRELIDKFILYDIHTLSFYPQLLIIGEDNEAWKELVRHILSEQAFMLELIKDLRQQIG